MDYKKLVLSHDKHRMLELIRSFPGQFEDAISLAYSWELPSGFGKPQYSGIIVQGMGGSGIGAAIARDLVQVKIKKPFVANRDYSMPVFVDDKWLVIAVSNSGNTEETLSTFNEARGRKMDIVCVSSGGILAKKCRKCIIIPAGGPPRTQLAMTFVPIIAVLEKLGIAREKKNLKETAAFLKKNIKEIEGHGKRLAAFLQGKIPVIYSDGVFDSTAERFHTQLAENSKTFSHWNALPELNHNEIVGYKPLEKKLAFVFFRDTKETKKEKKRMEFTKKIVAGKSSVFELRARGDSLLKKIFYLCLVGDFASYYLALLNKVDPSSTKSIERLKKELKK